MVILVEWFFNDAVKRGLLRQKYSGGGTAVRRLVLDNVKSSGLTLVELMVAVAVTSIIMALSTLIFVSQYKSYRTSHAVKTTETDIQKAVELVRDDVALAGWGVKPQMAFYLVDGGSSAPDQVYVSDISLMMDANNTQRTKQMRVLIDSGPMECGGCRRYIGASPDATHIPCNNATTNTYNVLDINCDGSTKELESVPVIVWASGSNATRIRITDSSGDLLPAGVSGESYVTPAVLYDLVNYEDSKSDPNLVPLYPLSLRRLARDTAGAQPMAEGVVDLQVIYGDNTTRPVRTSDYFGNNATDMNGTRYGRAGCNSTTCQMNSFDSSRISWINLYVVTRSARRTSDPDDPTSCRPAIANHSAGNATTCGYAYRVYVSRIAPLRRLH
jgi:prepilin-type N-terminal cleavage/methylation domain-containing protein